MRWYLASASTSAASVRVGVSNTGAGSSTAGIFVRVAVVAIVGSEKDILTNATQSFRHAFDMSSTSIDR